MGLFLFRGIVHTYVVLLRGINVGGRGVLPMRELTVLLEELGFESVRTYIQSGNVVVQTRVPLMDDAALRITRAIGVAKGFEPQVLVLSAAQWRDAITNNPYVTTDGKALHFFFLASVPDTVNTGRLVSLKAVSESYTLINQVFYLHAPEGVGRSKLASAVEACMGVPVTARNWNTVKKLELLLSA